MNFAWTPYATWPAVSAGLTLSLAAITWQYRRSALGGAFVAFCLSVSWWALGYAVELCARSFGSALFLADLQYLGLVWVAPLVYMVVVRFGGRTEPPSLAQRLCLWGFPVATLAVVAADPWIEIFRSNPRLQESHGLRLLAFEMGPWYILHVVWAYSLIATAMGMLAKSSLSTDALTARQSRVLLAAIVITMVGNVAHVLRLSPIPFLDPTPTLFTISASILAYSIFGNAFLKLLPIARDRVFDSLPDPVLVFDPHGKVVDANPAAKAIFPIGSEGALRLFESSLGEDQARRLMSQSRFLWQGRSFDVRRSPVGSPGEPLGHLIEMRDITELLDLHRDLTAARDAAEAANEAKSRFLANMSHELRTPINGVLGLVELMGDTPLDHRQREYLRAVRSCSQTLLGLVSDVLDLSRLEAGMMPMSPQTVDLDDAMQGIAGAYRALCRNEGLDFELRLDGRLGNASIDPTRLHQVLHNLLGNAIKFTERGSVRLAARRDGDDVEIEVADTGVGIPEAEQERVFRRFEQADATSARTYGGSGLGLAIVRQIVDSLGGSVGLESAPGRGSRFTVRLPLPEVAQADDDAPVEPNHPRLRILVAEDNDVNALVVVRQLEALGHTATRCANGREAVELGLANDYDVFLIDLHMPEFDGLEACRALRKAGRKQPLVALTASALVEEHDRCIQAGFDAYLTKPASRAEIERVLESVAGPPPNP